MSKVAAHYVALEFLRQKGTATPAEIEAHVGKGAYSSKYVCYLKLEGYEIETVKSGRTVVEYKFISDGDSATRNYQWVSPAKRNGAAPVAKKPKAVKVVSAPKPKKAKVVKQKAAAAKPKKEKSIMDDKYDEVEKTFGSSGAIGNYSVDPDWDSMDGIDVNNFLK